MITFWIIAGCILIIVFAITLIWIAIKKIAWVISILDSLKNEYNK